MAETAPENLRAELLQTLEDSEAGQSDDIQPEELHSTQTFLQNFLRPRRAVRGDIRTLEQESRTLEREVESIPDNLRWINRDAENQQVFIASQTETINATQEALGQASSDDQRAQLERMLEFQQNKLAEMQAELEALQTKQTELNKRLPQAEAELQAKQEHLEALEQSLESINLHAYNEDTGLMMSRSTAETNALEERQASYEEALQIVAENHGLTVDEVRDIVELPSGLNQAEVKQVQDMKTLGLNNNQSIALLRMSSSERADEFDRLKMEGGLDQMAISEVKNILDTELEMPETLAVDVAKLGRFGVSEREALTFINSLQALQEKSPELELNLDIVFAGYETFITDELSPLQPDNEVMSAQEFDQILRNVRGEIGLAILELQGEIDGLDSHLGGKWENSHWDISRILSNSLSRSTEDTLTGAKWMLRAQDPEYFAELEQGELFARQPLALQALQTRATNIRESLNHTSVFNAQLSMSTVGLNQSPIGQMADPRLLNQYYEVASNVDLLSNPEALAQVQLKLPEKVFISQLAAEGLIDLNDTTTKMRIYEGFNSITGEGLINPFAAEQLMREVIGDEAYDARGAELIKLYEDNNLIDGVTAQDQNLPYLTFLSEADQQIEAEAMQMYLLAIGVQLPSGIGLAPSILADARDLFGGDQEATMSYLREAGLVDANYRFDKYWYDRAFAGFGLAGGVVEAATLGALPTSSLGKLSKINRIRRALRVMDHARHADLDLSRAVNRFNKVFDLGHTDDAVATARIDGAADTARTSEAVDGLRAHNVVEVDFSAGRAPVPESQVAEIPLPRAVGDGIQPPTRLESPTLGAPSTTPGPVPAVSSAADFPRVEMPGISVVRGFSDKPPPAANNFAPPSRGVPPTRPSTPPSRVHTTSNDVVDLGAIRAQRAAESTTAPLKFSVHGQAFTRGDRVMYTTAKGEPREMYIVGQSADGGVMMRPTPLSDDLLAESASQDALLRASQMRVTRPESVGRIQNYTEFLQNQRAQATTQARRLISDAEAKASDLAEARRNEAMAEAQRLLDRAETRRVEAERLAEAQRIQDAAIIRRTETQAEGRRLITRAEAEATQADAARHDQALAEAQEFMRRAEAKVIEAERAAQAADAARMKEMARAAESAQSAPLRAPAAGSERGSLSARIPEAPRMRTDTPESIRAQPADTPPSRAESPTSVGVPHLDPSASRSPVAPSVGSEPGSRLSRTPEAPLAPARTTSSKLPRPPESPSPLRPETVRIQQAEAETRRIEAMNDAANNHLIELAKQQAALQTRRAELEARQARLQSSVSEWLTEQSQALGRWADQARMRANADALAQTSTTMRAPKGEDAIDLAPNVSRLPSAAPVNPSRLDQSAADTLPDLSTVSRQARQVEEAAAARRVELATQQAELARAEEALALENARYATRLAEEVRQARLDSVADNKLTRLAKEQEALTTRRAEIANNRARFAKQEAALDAQLLKAEESLQAARLREAEQARLAEDQADLARVNADFEARAAAERHTLAARRAKVETQQAELARAEADLAAENAAYVRRTQQDGVADNNLIKIAKEQTALATRRAEAEARSAEAARQRVQMLRRVQEAEAKYAEEIAAANARAAEVAQGRSRVTARMYEAERAHAEALATARAEEAAAVRRMAETAQEKSELTRIIRQAELDFADAARMSDMRRGLEATDLTPFRAPINRTTSFQDAGFGRTPATPPARSGAPGLTRATPEDDLPLPTRVNPPAPRTARVPAAATQAPLSPADNLTDVSRLEEAPTPPSALSQLNRAEQVRAASNLPAAAAALANAPELDIAPPETLPAETVGQENGKIETNQEATELSKPFPAELERLVESGVMAPETARLVSEPSTAEGQLEVLTENLTIDIINSQRLAIARIMADYPTPESAYGKWHEINIRIAEVFGIKGLENGDAAYAEGSESREFGLKLQALMRQDIATLDITLSSQQEALLSDGKFGFRSMELAKLALADITPELISQPNFTQQVQTLARDSRNHTQMTDGLAEMMGLGAIPGGEIGQQLRLKIGRQIQKAANIEPQDGILGRGSRGVLRDFDWSILTN